ncbi:ClpP/crotonase [Serendipita vermifera]|nr:ClpP/crotonase [Serendipita vermifera]
MQPVEFPSTLESLVTVSKAHEYVWVIELHNGADNRLTGPMCDALSQALDLVEMQWRDRWRPTFYDKNDTEKVNASGALILVANRKQQKFFSNGFEFPTLLKEPHFIPNRFVPIMEHLLGFPIPVIAAINGHCFAAGFALAMACDYRVMKASKAWLSMNELLFGAPIPHSFSALFNAKSADLNVVRKIFLEAHRFTSKEALDSKLVDLVVDGDSDDVFNGALEFALKFTHLPRSGVYGLIKKEVYGGVFKTTAEDPRMAHIVEEDGLFKMRMKPRL